MSRRNEIIIWVCVFFIVAVGLLALYSASYQNIRVPRSIFYDQLLFAVVGFIILFFLQRFDYHRFSDIAYFFYVLNIILLIGVHISGRHALGARRWFEVGGVSFQPSELMKLAIIFLLARYWAGRQQRFSTVFLNRFQILARDLLFPFFLTALPMFLIFKQPDLGTAILVFGIFCTMGYTSGMAKRYFFGFLGLCLAGLPFAIKLLKPYQKDRLLVFLNPNLDPLGAGYTIIQSKIAIGSGQLFGKGWLTGTQNQLNFLPERHTDFIFSVIGEEWGFFGAFLLTIFYFSLIWTMFKLAEQTDEPFGSQLIVGIASIWSLQAVINIGMVMGLCPIVGLTLPLVSYGRSSFLMFIVTIGIVLNICRRQRLR